MKLYRIQTIAPEFQGYQNVTFSWIVDKRSTPAERDAAALVEAYSPEGYHDATIDELFDLAEAEAFADWLIVNRPQFGEPKITEIKLPLPRDSFGFSCLSVGGYDDFLIPISADEPVRIQPLGFQVSAYFRRESGNH